MFAHACTVTIDGAWSSGLAAQRLQQLKDHGLVMNRDYVWRYCPSDSQSWDDEFNLKATFSSCTQIMFTDAAQATFYQLKWTQ